MRVSRHLPLLTVHVVVYHLDLAGLQTCRICCPSVTASFRQVAATGSLFVAPANLLHALCLSLLLDAWTRAIGCRANCQGMCPLLSLLIACCS